MAPPLTVTDVARYFLALQDEESGGDITNMKLQKLCYYAQAFSLAILGKPLFSARIKAWALGPVIPELWQKYRKHESSPIPRVDDLNLKRYDPEVRGLLDEIYDVYGQFSPWKLADMTHNEPPWHDTPRDAEITPEAMKDYFQHLID